MAFSLDRNNIGCSFLKSKKQKVDSETVEKVPKQILGGDAEKNDLTECATINDLMLVKGQETRENRPLIVMRGFFYRLVMHLQNPY